MTALLEVDNLTVRFDQTAAVDGVSFTIHPGERVGLIGESGSGKSMACLTILGLQPRVAKVTGSVRFEGNELQTVRDDDMRQLRGARIGTVFQEPMTALNPVMKVGAQLVTAQRIHGQITSRQTRARAIELAGLVGLPDPATIIDRYPHQLSGGQRQRVVIAMAVSCTPALVLADEPTTALDATVARRVLDLMVRLCDELGSALLLVTHDMGVATSTCDRLMVMRGGHLVEQGPSAELVQNPQQDYTRNLVTAARSTGLDLAGAHAVLARQRGEGATL
ncbi:ABC transporter ATP-binding protein [Tessaracoccus sp. SD287]|uniref:ABC transporter ATP-binding protein n=1 Tax=Tessaracoccus sp. SD287 TaxID=2782008 RepID=UPI001A973746|nr:ABC transporter ATP-binding protein [Tessaracoccus sp. SD287]MBO1030941.1 ABC transporter ATP-binding protein [Tessaracoccus sp. SD287]